MALIKTSNSTPSVYTKKSRDFQLIGHIYEAMFNSSKLATDMLDKMMPNPNFDERLLNLSTTTVGFIRKHEYDKNDLNMVLNSFAYLLRTKGTKGAIASAINILLRSQGISDAYIIEVDDANKLITLSLSTRLNDTILLLDLFEYLLPFGFNYRIIQAVAAQIENNTTEITYNGSATHSVLTNKGIVNDTFNTTIETTYKMWTLHSEPSDWSTNYTSYFEYDSVNDQYVHVSGGSAPTWQDNKYYMNYKNIVVDPRPIEDGVIQETL